MRQIGLAILSCFVWLVALDVPLAASEVTALKILSKSFDAQTQQLGYELWNESDKTITAWRLSLARSDPHGHAQRSILDQDFFERPPSIELGSRLGPLAPGASLATHWRLGLEAADPGPTALSLKVTVVVFEDLTFEGESDAAAVILEARTARVAEIGRVLTDLESQQRRLHWRPGVVGQLEQRAQMAEAAGKPVPNLRKRSGEKRLRCCRRRNWSWRSGWKTPVERSRCRRILPTRWAS